MYLPNRVPGAQERKMGYKWIARPDWEERGHIAYTQSLHDIGDRLRMPICWDRWDAYSLDTYPGT